MWTDTWLASAPASCSWLSRTRSEQADGLPAIVGQFRKYSERVADWKRLDGCQVIICIDEMDKIRASAGAAFDAPRYDQAVALFTEVGLADTYAEFLTIPAYERMP